MKTARITIVGMGPRGLSLLEQLVEQLHAAPLAWELKIDIVEPGDCGPGSHPVQQPDHLLTNTVASQVGIFGEDSKIMGKQGLSLTQWARYQGYRRFGTRFLQVQGEGGAEISDQDHLPRNMLGEYLRWAFERVAAQLPATVSVEHHRRRVVDLVPLPERGFQVVLDCGFEYRADYVFLATGHGMRRPTDSDLAYEAFAAAAARRNPKALFLASPYPSSRLDAISDAATVAVQGLGLTAYDVISTLTVGRGGQFTAQAGGLRYTPSGREPRIRLFSRQCLPFAARGVNQKGIAGRHQARFLTVDAIRLLQAQAVARTGSQQLDFGSEVLPLLEREMAYAYRAASAGLAPNAETFEPTAAEQEAIRQLLYPLKGRTFPSFDSFRRFFRLLVERDFEEAEKGNLSSPVKAATDVLRDCREGLRAAVEFAGLTPSSNPSYSEDFVATSNRISFGPPRRRNAELLALMDAGLLDIAGGPGNCVEMDEVKGEFCISNQFIEERVRHYADVLVIARLDPYSPSTDASSLSRQMLSRGLVRPFANGSYQPGGLDITPDLRVVAADGSVHDNLWALGFPVEGAHFYTHALPRPLMNSRFTQDAKRCIADLLQMLQRQPTVRRDTGPAPVVAGEDRLPAELACLEKIA
ncbi:FAD/NAD(P)-binding protein [Paucibacter sp. APW11]|uniref:FAD/NAD(P)-binding protein n=1 Tax=Roseateles aquae TaxID=3077235 RepID=A0ABU3PHS5_9BURK|nr:FAD/NAD(P)-binding protein [Paucibacter sp. APW11]MDT9001657.1 FAD/NAD(P)-binding protein [Paucibacter sp. APW11]